MAKTSAYLIHWNDDEARSRLMLLRNSGIAAKHIRPQGVPGLKVIAERPRSLVIIDLSRLPSQGRDIAILLRRNGKTRHIPLLFLDGNPDKVSGIRKHLPDAVYASWKTLERGLKRALRQRKADLVVPKSSLAGYSGTPLPKKLGIQPDSTVALVDAPDDFEETLGKLPLRALLERHPRGMQTLVLWFATALHDYQRRIRTIAGSTEKIWIIWPKKSSGVPTDLSERNVREVGLSVGLVDYKVCAVDATWSGLLFTHRKT